MWESITILMGPPGSGKTTLGKHVASITEKVFFISVGEYMRNKLSLSPPFHKVDRFKIFEKIIFEEFAASKKPHLLIDCNPFPPEMWDAATKHIVHFKKNRLFLINANTTVLMQRLTSRNRTDSLLFSNEERLNYYLKNVDPIVKKLKAKEITKSLQNETNCDFEKCAQVITKPYI